LVGFRLPTPRKQVTYLFGQIWENRHNLRGAKLSAKSHLVRRGLFTKGGASRLKRNQSSAVAWVCMNCPYEEQKEDKIS